MNFIKNPMKKRPQWISHKVKIHYIASLRKRNEEKFLSLVFNLANQNYFAFDLDWRDCWVKSDDSTET